MAQRCRSRGWAITVNNFTDEDIEAIVDLDADYWIAGFETGKKGTLHIQGYLHWHNPIEFNTIKKVLPRAHIERAKKSPEININYCSKDCDYVEFGDRPICGKRSDLDNIYENIKRGATMEEIVAENPGSAIRYSKNVERIRNMITKVNKPVPTEIYYSRDYRTFIPDVLKIFDREKVLFVKEDKDCYMFEPTYHTVLAMTTKCLQEDVFIMAGNGIPFQVAAGFERKEILPKYIIFCDQYFAASRDPYGVPVLDLKFLQDLGTEVSGGNTSPPETSESLFDDSILEENFTEMSDDDIDWD